MNDVIDQIAREVGERIPGLLVEMKDKISEAAASVAEETAGTEKRPVLSIALAVKWNLNTRCIEMSAAVSARHKATLKFPIEDPDQINMFENQEEEQ